MRVASRHMQKLKPAKTGPVGWLFVALFCSSIAYVAVTETKFFLVAVTVLSVLYFLMSFHSKRQDRRLQALAHSRQGQSICEFARDFDARVVDTWIIRAVYEQLQGQLTHIHPAFPIRADDRLIADLLLDGDDIDMDLVPEVEARTGRSLAGSVENPYFGKVITLNP